MTEGKKGRVILNAQKCLIIIFISDGINYTISLYFNYYYSMLRRNLTTILPKILQLCGWFKVDQDFYKKNMYARIAELSIIFKLCSLYTNTSFLSFCKMTDACSIKGLILTAQPVRGTTFGFIISLKFLSS
jgi:hypothetical protein